MRLTCGHEGHWLQRHDGKKSEGLLGLEIVRIAALGSLSWAAGGTRQRADV